VRISEIMSSPVVTTRSGALLKDVARLLVERDVSAIPVLDAAGELVGMVSEADVLRIELHEDPRRHVRPDVGHVGSVPERVEEVMNGDVVAVAPDADVAEVAALMLDLRIRSIPVVSGSRIDGIVSRRDVLRVLLRSDAEMVRDLEGLMGDLPSGFGTWTVRVDARSCAGPAAAPRT
jgi:CBS domain-containing protein